LNRRIERRSMSTADAGRAVETLRDIDQVLGILPDPEPGDGLDPAISALLEARVEARTSRDFAASDRLRDELAALGVTVEDTRDGQRWRRAIAVGQGGPAGPPAASLGREGRQTRQEPDRQARQPPGGQGRTR